MQTETLKSRHEVPGARAVVLFGGNPHMRDHVVRYLGPRLNVTVVGALSEEEGFATLEALRDRVGAVLIGGRYDETQRRRIRAFVAKSFAGVHVSEPGVNFPYDEELIVRDLGAALGQVSHA